MNSKVNEMWTALESYQAQADANSHGRSWALMCSKKTSAAANSAANSASCAHNDTASKAAYTTAIAVHSANYASCVDRDNDWAYRIAAYNYSNYYAQNAIDLVTKATGETK